MQVNGDGIKETAWRDDVDRLRALAVTAVVVNHAFPRVLPGGFVGVDIFFVISGFVITSLVQNSNSNSPFSLIGFYFRRLMRVLPSLVLMIGMVGFLGFFLLSPAERSRFGTELGFTGFFSSNIWFWLSSQNYFSPDSQESLLLHTWSLAVEEQFYLIFPTIFLFVYRRLPKLRTSIIASAAILSFVMAEAGVRAQTSASFFLLPPRVGELLIGTLAAQLGVSCRPVAALYLHRFGAVLVAGSIAFVTDSTPFPGLHALPVTFGTALLILFPTNPRKAAVRRPVETLGKMSYAMYLWHWPLLVLLDLWTGFRTPVFAKIMAISTALILSVCTWRYVEKPVREKRDSIVKKGIGTLLLLGVSVLLGILGFALPQLPSPLDSASVISVDSGLVQGGTLFTSICSRKLAPVKGMCSVLPSKKELGSIVVWGDSHSEQTAGALLELGEEGYGIHLAATPSCPPLPFARLSIFSRNSSRSADCRAANSSVSAVIASIPNVRLVVLSARWTPYLADSPNLGTDDRWLISKDSELYGKAASIELARVLALTVSDLTNRGMRVLVVDQVAEFAHGPHACVVRSALFGLSRSCKTAQKADNRKISSLRAAIDSAGLNNRRVGVVHPGDSICDTKFCEVQKDGQLLFADANHLSRAGVKFFSGTIHTAASLLLSDGARN